MDPVERTVDVLNINYEIPGWCVDFECFVQCTNDAHDFWIHHGRIYLTILSQTVNTCTDTSQHLCLFFKIHKSKRNLKNIFKCHTIRVPDL